MNGAEFLCESLLINGIDVCFANPGTSEMHFVAALDKQPGMRCVLGLFEGVVTGAADGYARMAGKPAATLLHLGSGLGNGLANLHNAKRARSPVVNIVGDHARHHLVYDAPLTSDIKGIALPVSNHVLTAESPETIERDIHQGIEAAMRPHRGVSTIILPADVAWSDVPKGLKPTKIAFPSSPRVSDDIIARAATALKSDASLLFVGGRALHGRALALAHTIARHTGADLLAEGSNARMQRGIGAPPIDKLPYPIDAAIARLRSVREMICVGSRYPVAFFAYPGKPSVLAPAECRHTELASPQQDIEDALERLMALLGVGELAAPESVQRPALPVAAARPLNGESVCRVVAALLPDNAIVTDEGVTQGRSFFSHSHGSSPHDYLQLTGGAIGIGLPLAAGAAIACPDRKVVALQADGSGMYTMQALWTQARENLNCLTVIFANRRYAILQNEMANVGVTHMGSNAQSMLSLENPDIGWTRLAEGLGVKARAVSTVSEFIEAFEQGLKYQGPFLIEAVLSD
ncbi:acetolactate synthase large subunit [Parapusillimonas sp. JC17]|uniref:acetolactate synthase large subunit n=1 Tax=Parapusillimonas sp. JC17 TaxID=3445768 RepID=UPI003FA1717E